MRTKHYLKTWPEYFLKVTTGEKTFELRKNDRNYQVGDLVKLEEYDPEKEKFTKLVSCWFEITYLLHGPHSFGIQDGYVIMQLKPVVYFDTRES